LAPLRISSLYPYLCPSESRAGKHAKPSQHSEIPAMLRFHFTLLLSVAFFSSSPAVVHGAKIVPGPIDDDVTIDQGDDGEWLDNFTPNPIAPIHQAFIDCEFDSCTIAHRTAVPVKENSIVEYMTLPKNFKIKVNYFYDVIPPEAARTNSQQKQSIYEIWSLDLDQPLLSIYRSIYGGQALRIQYNNYDVELDDNWYGGTARKAYQLAFGWNEITIEILEDQLFVYQRIYDYFSDVRIYKYDLQYPGAVHSKNNIFFASQPMTQYRPERRYDLQWRLLFSEASTVVLFAQRYYN
jgi:hypothetical protein